MRHFHTQSFKLWEITHGASFIRVLKLALAKVCFFETCYHESGSLGILGALTDTVVAVHTLEDFVTAGFLWRAEYFY